MQPISRTLSELDCTARMFLATICPTDEDLEELGLLGMADDRHVSRTTAARSVLHRLLATEPPVRTALAYILDMRHADLVMRVRAMTSPELETLARDTISTLDGDRLAGWSWAVLTDPRPEVVPIARRLMGECYVRGMRTMVENSSRDGATSVN